MRKWMVLNSELGPRSFEHQLEAKKDCGRSEKIEDDDPEIKKWTVFKDQKPSDLCLLPGPSTFILLSTLGLTRGRFHQGPVSN